MKESESTTQSRLFFSVFPQERSLYHVELCHTVPLQEDTGEVVLKPAVYLLVA